MAFKNLTPEEREAKSRDREAKSARERADRESAERAMVAGLLIVFGFLLLVIGLWFLVLAPGEDTMGSRAVVNLQRLYIGQSAAIVGAIFFATGLHLRNRS
jgi:hypothetical protein